MSLQACISVGSLIVKLLALLFLIDHTQCTFLDNDPPARFLSRGSPWGIFALPRAAAVLTTQVWVPRKLNSKLIVESC